MTRRPPEPHEDLVKGSDGRASTDLAWLVVTAAILSALAMRYRTIDAITDWSNAFNQFNLNGAMALFLLAPLCATVFSYRRYQDAKRVRAELVRLSLHDSLTGLPNRLYLHEWLHQDLTSSRHAGDQVAVSFIDLDRFKIVNDTYGHEVGDALMVAVAERLRETLSENERIIRYGGDEFVVISARVANATIAERTAARLVEALEAPFHVGTDTMRISTSIGVSVTEPQKSHLPEELIREADAAMYQAKSEGRGNYVMFDPSMNRRLTAMSAEQRLRQAIERGEFHLVYQPLVHLSTGHIEGVEALIRWTDPERGVVQPDEFVPVLEETGLIVPVGAWVLEQACQQARDWMDEFPGAPPFTMTVNVSARQLAQVDFRDVVVAALRSSEVPPEYICLEITEGTLMLDVDSAWTALRQAKALGLRLALDDFGTGYSSLSYVRKFTLDILKIDRSFVDGLGVNREDAAIVEHVIGMAHALGIKTVAEGVENETQIAALRAYDCDFVQGFLFSEPVAADVISRLFLAEMEEARGDAQETSPPRALARAASLARRAMATEAGAFAIDEVDLLGAVRQLEHAVPVAHGAGGTGAGPIAAAAVPVRAVSADAGMDPARSGAAADAGPAGAPHAESAATRPPANAPVAPTPPRAPTAPRSPAPRDSSAAVLLPKLREFRPDPLPRPPAED